MKKLIIIALLVGGCVPTPVYEASHPTTFALAPGQKQIYGMLALHYCERSTPFVEDCMRAVGWERVQ